MKQAGFLQMVSRWICRLSREFGGAATFIRVLAVAVISPAIIMLFSGSSKTDKLVKVCRIRRDRNSDSNS
jgi:hypothetical protein